MAKKIGLITRGDDCGSNPSANSGIMEAASKGILKNVSFMTSCAYIEEAAAMFKDRKDLCFGLHATINAEWDSYRWGPVSRLDEVSSLVDSKGHFFQTTQEVYDRKGDLDEIMLEINNQLDKAIRLGLDIRYSEMHMGFGWVAEGLDKAFNDWCISKGLLNGMKIGDRLPDFDGDKEGLKPTEILVERLKKVKSGPYLIVGHPAYDNEEMRSLGHDGYPGHVVASQREWERRIFIDSNVVDFCNENNIVPIRYDEWEDYI